MTANDLQRVHCFKSEVETVVCSEPNSLNCLWRIGVIQFQQGNIVEAAVLLQLQAQDFDPRLTAHEQNGLTEYEVVMHTADVQDAATDADVFLVLYSATGVHFGSPFCMN